MNRIIVILIITFIILSILRNMIRKYRSNSYPAKKTYDESKSVSEKKHNDDNNITDAKFEEIK